MNEKETRYPVGLALRITTRLDAFLEKRAAARGISKSAAARELLEKAAWPKRNKKRTAGKG